MLRGLNKKRRTSDSEIGVSRMRHGCPILSRRLLDLGGDVYADSSRRGTSTNDAANRPALA
jgi:hypothetical protein